MRNCFRYGAGCLLAVLLCSGMARADGDGPTRALTAGEKAAFSNTLDTIAKALPPPPSGWIVKVKPSSLPPATVFEKAEKGPGKLRYTGRWLDQSQKERRAAKEREQAMNAKPPSTREMDARMSATEKRMEAQKKIFEEITAAAQKGDQAAMKKAQEKLNVLQRENQAAMQEMYPSQVKAAADAPIADGCLEIEVTVNETAVGLLRIKPLGLPGLQSAWQVDDGNPQMRDCPHGRAVVLLGAWRQSSTDRGYTYFRSSWPDGTPHTKVKNILVSVRASETRSRDYLSRVKWDELNRLLAK